MSDNPSRRLITGLALAAPLAGPTLFAGRALAQGGAVSPPPAGAQAAPAEAAPDSAEHEPDTNLATNDTASSHMLAPVMVNGRGPYQFIVDTGANRSAIGSALAEELELKPGAPIRMHTVAGARTRPTVMIDELRVADRVQRRLRVPTFPITGMTADGVLGVDWLKNRRLAFQFKTRTLEISGSTPENNATFFDRSGVVVPARLRSGQITIIDADMSGKKINAMIDTGAQLSMGNEALREQIRAYQNRGDSQSIDLITVTGERLTGELLYVPFIRLGGLLLGNVPIVFARVHVFSVWNMERDPSIILGMDLLRQFNAIILDYAKARVRFELT